MNRPDDEYYGRIAYNAYVADSIDFYRDRGLAESLEWNKIPPYNQEQWIKAALAVVLATCKDIETKLLDRPHD